MYRLKKEEKRPASGQKMRYTSKISVYYPYILISGISSVLNIFELKWDYIISMQFFMLYPNINLERIKKAGIRSKNAIYE